MSSALHAKANKESETERKTDIVLTHLKTTGLKNSYCTLLKEHFSQFIWVTQ